MRKLILTLAALAAFTLPALAQSKSDMDKAHDNFQKGMDAMAMSITAQRDNLCPKQVEKFRQDICLIRFAEPIFKVAGISAEVVNVRLIAGTGDKTRVVELNQKIKKDFDDLQAMLVKLAKDYK